MSHHPLPSAVPARWLLVLALAACRPVAAPGGGVATTACPANPAWLTSAALPTEVANGGKSACDFEQFMWQSMFALVQPASGSTLQFETWMPSYGIFVNNGTPTAWGQEPPNECGGTQPGQPRLYSDIFKQAGIDQPLMAQNGELVYYGMSVNKAEYDMITSCNLYMTNCAGPLKPGNQGIDLIQRYPSLALPDTAVELKTSWMVLGADDVSSGRFYVVPGWIKHDGEACRKVQLGLTGIHIVSKTPSFPALIWATFEHRNNAPDCSTPGAPPPLGGKWSFFDPNCPDCIVNTYQKGKPGQICRMHPHGDSSIGTFPDGNDCSSDPNQFACLPTTKQILADSTQAITAINQSVQALIKATPAFNQVWANYELVGNVWTVNRTVPPTDRALNGALSAANTSMESFVQNGVAAISNPYSCLSCHNMMGPSNTQNLPPVGLSHLFDNAQLAGGCSNGALPAACTAYTQRR